jgi:pyruvate/2-oxoglutarate dehydrogenase complex dihydrolipoamide dehydrogenase (E3) component
MAQKFDALIIGTGQAGSALAARLDKEGLKVALAEHGKFGGTCVNDGCTPHQGAHGERPRRAHGARAAL